MNRRGFLGSLFGLVASAPFLFKTINDPIQRVKLPYNAFVRESSGIWIQAPGIQLIEPIKNGFEFIVEPLHVRKAVMYDAMMLQTDRGEVIFDTTIQSVTGVEGDILNMSYELSSPYENLLLDELVHKKLCEMRGG